jgi:hypothetical protein
MSLDGTYSRYSNEGGSLGNVPQKPRKNFYGNSVCFGLLFHFQKYFLHSINENGRTIRNITSFFQFLGNVT